MSIKSKTRKILWSKSGNRCAVCKKALVRKFPSLSDEVIIGEECHIISSKQLGPRGTYKTLVDYDVYDNLILLCANDHKLIDQFPETFTVEILSLLKDNHERWIESAIEKDLMDFIKSRSNIELLDEIVLPQQLEQIINGAHFFHFDLSSITSNIQSVEVSELFDNIRDYSDVYDDLDLKTKTQLLISYVESIHKLNTEGIRLFGKGIKRGYKFMNLPKSVYYVAIVVAFSESSNPESIQNGKLMVKLPDNFSPSI